jgi:hypothetical protein
MEVQYVIDGLLLTCHKHHGLMLDAQNIVYHPADIDYGFYDWLTEQITNAIALHSEQQNVVQDSLFFD